MINYIPNQKNINWLHITTVLVLALIAISAGIGLRDPWIPDEPRYVLMAKNMVDTGNWIIPYRGIEIYSDKPPVFMWLIAALYSLFGSINITFLLPSLFSAMGVLIITYDITRRCWSHNTAIISVFILLGSYQFMLQAKAAEIDMTLTLFTTFALYGLIRTLYLNDEHRWLYLAFLSMGIGVITKGVGFLPILLLFPYAYTRMRKWADRADNVITPKQWSISVLMLMIPILSWVMLLLYELFVNQNHEVSAYINDIMIRQTMHRYVDSWHHQRPFYYLIVSLFTLWFPAILVLPWAIKNLYLKFKDKNSLSFSLFIWIALVVLFFSISPGKRGVYILPALPAFALLMAPVVEIVLGKKTFKQAARLLVIVVSLGIVIFSVSSMYIENSLLDKYMLPMHFWIAMLCLGVFGVVLWYASKQYIHGSTALIIILLGAWFNYGLWAYPSLNQRYSARYFMNNIDIKIGVNYEVGILQWREGMLLHTARPFKDFGLSTPLQTQIINAKEWLEGDRNRRLLVQKPVMEKYLSNYESSYFDNRKHREWFVIKPINL